MTLKLYTHDCKFCHILTLISLQSDINLSFFCGTQLDVLKNVQASFTVYKVGCKDNKIIIKKCYALLNIIIL